jgi:hypothetical protein
MKRTILAALCLGLGVSSSAFGHDDGMKQKIKDFGRSVGHAYVCASSEDKAGFKADSEHVYAMTLEELGPGPAYVFAVSVGVGASMPASKLDCAKHAKDWTDMKGKLGLAEVKQ